METTRGADLHLANAPSVTCRIGDEDTFWGLEAAALWGPFALQGEYAQLDVELPTGNFIRGNPPFAPGQLASVANPFIGDPDPTFNGWYIEGSWFFGGHKTYEDDGRWGRPKVDNPMFHGSGGWGALQLVGKYDVLDQSDAHSTTREHVRPRRSIRTYQIPKLWTRWCRTKSRSAAT